MSDRRHAPTAEERLRDLRREQARLRRERMEREVAGPIWHRMVSIAPVLFRREGAVVARRLLVDRADVVVALRGLAVLALDTAMRAAHGSGFLSGSDVFAYVESEEVLDRLGARGLVDSVPFADTVLVRPWAGPPRLIACVTPAPPAARVLPSGDRVVTDERLGRELIGLVGRRADLFGRFERLVKQA